jgi:hypothetical protein
LILLSNLHSTPIFISDKPSTSQIISPVLFFASSPAVFPDKKALSFNFLFEKYSFKNAAISSSAKAPLTVDL